MTAVAAPASGVEKAAEQPARSARGPGLSTVLLTVFVAAGVWQGLAPLHDNSFMWHLRTGRYMLDEGTLPRGDLYSFSEPGIHWVLQSWLAELLYGVVDRIGGSFGLQILGGIVGGLVGGLLFWIAQRGTRDRIRAALIGAAAFAAMMNVWSPRPLMLGLLAMLVVVITVEYPSSVVGRHPYITLPFTMWLWINVHGSWVVGFGYLALHLLGRAWEGTPPREGHERTLLRASFLSAAVVFVNPYFLDLVLFPVRLMTRGEVLKDVAEWQSPDFGGVGGMLFGVWLAVTIVVLASARATMRPGRRDILIAVVFSLLGLYATRNIGLVVIATLPIVARYAAPSEPRPDERRPGNRLFVAAGFALIAFMFVNTGGAPHWELENYPVAAWDDVREEQHLEGRRLLTTDAWAAYVILRSWPDQTVFFDDRYDMYSVQLNEQFSDVMKVRPNWQQVLDDHEIEVIMWGAEDPLSQVLAKTEGWTQTYSDDRSVVFVRGSLASRVG
jgi:hypothetical protein